MEVIIIKPRKKTGYKIKILSTAIMRKGRVVGELTQDIKFTEEEDNGFTISFR